MDAALDACSRKFISPLGWEGRRRCEEDFEVIQWSPDDRRKDGRRELDAFENRALVVDYGLDAVPLCRASPLS